MTEETSSNRTLIAGWLVILWFAFVGLGSYDLSAPDEPRFALVAQEMMDNGNWLLPHRNERPLSRQAPALLQGSAARQDHHNRAR